MFSRSSSASDTCAVEDSGLEAYGSTHGSSRATAFVPSSLRVAADAIASRAPAKLHSTPLI